MAYYANCHKLRLLNCHINKTFVKVSNSLYHQTIFTEFSDFNSKEKCTNKSLKMMKFLLLSLGLALGDSNRRYLEKFLNKFNKKWDVATNYWIDYGCNCRGDLDRTAKNLGKPLDALDK